MFVIETKQGNVMQKLYGENQLNQYKPGYATRRIKSGKLQSHLNYM